MPVRDSKLVFMLFYSVDEGDWSRYDYCMTILSKEVP